MAATPPPDQPDDLRETALPDSPNYPHTDDWVADGPPPADVPTPEMDVYTPPPFSPEVAAPGTSPELIEIIPPPAGLKPVDDDVVFLADEATGGPDSGPTSGRYGRMESIPVPTPTAEASGFMPIPPSALMSDILADAPPPPVKIPGLADTVIPPPPADEVPVGRMEPPTEPASGWLPSDTRLKETQVPAADPRDTRPPSAVDFALPDRDLVDQPSDIFTTDKHPRPGGSDILGGGATGESELYQGAATSDVLAHHPPPSSLAGTSDVLSAAFEEERGSSRFDKPERNTERVAFDLPPGLMTTNTGSGVGFDLDPNVGDPFDRTLSEPAEDDDSADELRRGASDSNLLEAFDDDGTAMDFDLAAAASPGASGVNLHDPDAHPDSDPGPRSSIFTVGAGGSAEPPSADLGRVDFGQIPMMGSSDEGTEMMVNPEHDASLSVFQAAEQEQSSTDSGLIDWSEDAPVPAAEVTQSTGRPDAVLTAAAGAAAAAASRRMPPPVAPPVAPPSTGRQATTAPRRIQTTSPVLDLDSPAPGRTRYGIAGLVTGLVAGAGITFGVLSGGAAPTNPAPTGGAPQQPVANNNPATPPAAGGLAAGQALLAAGDPAAALAALEQSSEDSAEVKAARGRARWMARARAAAADRAALMSDDAELTKATADLQAAVDAAAGNNDPAAQKAGATAALHLGLVKEAAGDPKAAQQVYTDAGGKFPAFKKWFDSAKLRVTTMMKNADGSPAKEFSRLPIEEADRLAAFGDLLLAPVQETDDEAGFHFWEAINLAANWQNPTNFDKAITAIGKARAAHDARRRQLVGLGLNPVSDPREQLFLRACDELRFYWEFKKKIYADSAGMELARKGGTGGALTAMLAAVKDGGAGGPKLKEAEAALAKAMKAGEELENLRKAADTAAAAERTARKKADDQVAKLMTDVTAAQQGLKDTTAALKATNDRVMAAEAALAPVIAKLKAAKLIPETATQTEAVAALPEAARKAALVAGDSDAMAKQLADAQKKLIDAETSAKAAEAKAATARADAEKEMKTAVAAAEKKASDLEAKAKDADAKTGEQIKNAVADARAELATKLDAATKAAAAEKDRAEAERAKVEQVRAETAKLIETRLAAQADDFRAQLAAVRAGASAQLLDVERAAADRAARAYEDGVTAYFVGRYSDAEARLTKAAADDPADARIAYFLGLAKFALGKADAAQAEFRKGAALEARGRPGSRAVGAALERVQGPARAAVEAVRP